MNHKISKNYKTKRDEVLLCNEVIWQLNFMTNPAEIQSHYRNGRLKFRN